ncbi:uncharacterized protein [Rutidosis leptorrhynchoides]|uniref:uncharacterized protein n=1 Tax=Rutidosis leptorrhynchoides TaxID=125765 RepID=UPI003A99CB97
MEMVDADLINYTNRFQEFAFMNPHMTTPEYLGIQHYINGLPDGLRRGVAVLNPRTIQEAICMANQLINKPGRKGDSKRKLAILQQVVMLMGHLSKNCRLPAVTTYTPATKDKPFVPTCYSCGEIGHTKPNCPKKEDITKNADAGKAKGRAFVMTAEEARDDEDVITGTFLVNNCYASVLFDTGADRSYVSTELCALFDEKPQNLDTKCLVEMANGKFIKVDRIYKECNLTLANKTFKVDLLPVEIGSFDVVLGMDWLSPMKVGI